MYDLLALAAFLLGVYKISEMFTRMMVPWPQWWLLWAVPLFALAIGTWGAIIGLALGEHIVPTNVVIFDPNVVA
jgi:hypothetical protein